MTSQAVVTRQGNSLGISFPCEFAEKAQIKEKSLVEIKTEGNMLIITSVKKPKKSIQELFELYPADYIEDEEFDWGAAVGDEVW